LIQTSYYILEISKIFGINKWNKRDYYDACFGGDWQCW
jgi:hypothetical protein